MQMCPRSCLWSLLWSPSLPPKWALPMWIYINSMSDDKNKNLLFFPKCSVSKSVPKRFLSARTLGLPKCALSFEWEKHLTFKHVSFLFPHVHWCAGWAAISLSLILKCSFNENKALTLIYNLAVSFTPPHPTFSYSGLHSYYKTLSGKSCHSAEECLFLQILCVQTDYTLQETVTETHVLFTLFTTLDKQKLILRC